MVKWLHIIGVGTSLLSNFERRFPEEARRLGVTGWYRLSPSDPGQYVAEEEAGKGFSSGVFRRLYELLSGDPRGFSAELNAFLGYIDFAGHAPPSEVGVLLYTTDTGVSWLIGRVLREYLASKGYIVEGPYRIRGLGRSVKVFEEGLVNLVDEVVSRVVEAKRKGVSVYINATPGYKAETTFLVLAGLLAGATTIYYIHEAFREPISLPILPLAIKREIIELLNKIDEAEKYIAEEILRDYNYTTRTLREMGLIEEIGGKIRVRKWAKKIISLLEE